MFPNIPVVYTNGRSKAMVPVLFVLCVSCGCPLRDFFLCFFSVRCFIFAYSGTCLALWSPCLGRESFAFLWFLALRKHAYSNICKILQPKKELFQIKNSDMFHIPAQNINCGYSLEPPRRGGSNEYPQSMFSAKFEK